MAEMEYLPGGIRERMEDLRNRRKLTLKEVAEKTGIDYSTLSRIENGNVKKVGDDVLLKLARFFGVSTDFLLGITNVPDKKNYTIEELGLTPEAARNLYTGSVNNRVINLLLAHPDFGTLTNRIADYLDDRMAAGIAAQNQLYDSISELMMRIGKEEKALRQAATTQAKEAKALRRKLKKHSVRQRPHRPRKRRLCVGSSMQTNSRKLKPCLRRFFPPSRKSIRPESRKQQRL